MAWRYPREGPDRISISGSLVRRFLLCGRQPYMDRFRDPEEARPRENPRVLEDLDVDNDVPDDEWRARAIYGYVTRGRSDGARGVVVAPTGVDIRAWTLEQMEAGARMISRGYLRAGGFSGSPQRLRRERGRSDIGNWHYAPASRSRGDRARRFQMTLYALLLERVQGRRPKHFTCGHEVYDVDDHVDELHAIVKEIRRTFRELDDPGPFLTSKCSGCQWKAACTVDAKADGHLSLVPGLQQKTARKLNDIGVYTLHDLVAVDRERLAGIFKSPGGPRSVVAHAKAALSGKARMVGKPALPRSRVDVFVDFETRLTAPRLFDAPAVQTVLMVGALIRCDGVEKFVQFFHDRDGSDDGALVKFYRHIHELPKPRTVFHFGTHERSILERARPRRAKRHVLTSMCDVMPFARDHIALGARQRGLKDIAAALGFVWRDPDIGGENVEALWNAYTKGSAEAGAALARYNEDDVRALAMVVDWLRGERRRSGARRSEPRRRT